MVLHANTQALYPINQHAVLSRMISKSQARPKWFVAGLAFAILWASAATATKIGLLSSQPLVLAVIRFGIAALIMLFLSHVVFRHRFPRGKEWKQLFIYALLNITIYLGFYVIALQSVTAGIAALAIATNPVIISFISVLYLKQRLTASLVLSILVCVLGVLCAAWPLFHQAVVSKKGLLILFFSMFSYSIGAIYFSLKKWNGLHLFTINGWQTLIGGLLLLPFAIFYFDADKNQFNNFFWISVLWLAIPVSMLAVQLWLWLLKTNALKAGLWLFLCPLFGFAISGWLMREPVTLYTASGIAFVIAGLLIAQKRNTGKLKAMVQFYKQKYVDKN